jgi:D-glycero-alpha-D-manno-heptose-7-phosphate kinase
MKISAKAPCRVDLAGGTLDIWPLYLHHKNAVTVNFAVNRYTSCVIQTRAGTRINLTSRDLNQTESFDSLDALRRTARYKLPLAAYILRFFTPGAGLDIVTHSEAPAGAGISGSSSLIISTVSALNRLCGAGYNIETLREIAQNIEAQIIRVPTGCQDYYPAMYGGISAIELSPAGIRRIEIPIPHAELNRRVVLAYTGEPRNSGINNWEVTKAHIDGDKAVHRNFDRIAAIANGMRAAVSAQDWREMGRLLREEWSHRKKNAPGITTPLIDRLVEVTRKAGSTGAKVCGAGGGGCVLFLVEPDAQQRVADVITREGATVLPVTVAPRGVRIQTS